ncbi:MAG: CCA tRNA nucleotidyltransferase [Nanoarchaeota archaeon]|nr:CCA tRNA nucleotidyltransferase [Nanoarchaeota archaeon]
MRFLKEVVEDVKPSKDYEKDILDRVNTIIGKINRKLKDGKAILGGSGAKGTWLKAFDADIFVKFKYSKYKDNDGELSDILERVLKKDFKIKRLHGSRDYFQLKQGGFTFEIVPILDIKKAEQAKNITDVSPLHAKWVLKYKKLQNEVRLVKQFCKAQGVYGAESYIMGFSGYICEILTVYYGSFLKLTRKAAKWKEKEVIDVKKYYKRKDVFRELNKSKLVSPLIVIDPVQADRNAAAALSFENFDKFRKACSKFLKKPSKKFFEEKEFSTAKIREKNKQKKVLFLDVKPLGGKKDVIGCKLVKALEFINNKLTEDDFKVFEHGWDWDGKAVFYFVLDKKVLNENVEKIGPPIKIKEHVKGFKKKHKKTFVKRNRIFALDKRKFRKSEELIKSLFRNKYLKNKIKSIKFIK